MNSIKTYVNGLGKTTRTVLLGLAVVFVSAGIAQAATTISTNVTTAGNISTTGSGTLSIAGLATLLAGATTTQLTLGSSDTIKNLSASTTAISGSVTADADLTLLNAQSATSTATVGCIISTATSSATKIRLMYNTQATTSINNATVRGVVVWGYGSSCPAP